MSTNASSFEYTDQIDSQPNTRIRLNKRGKAVIGALTVGAVLAAGYAGAKAVAPAEFDGTQVVVVEPGDTEWQLITDNVDGIEGVDVRDAIDAAHSDERNADTLENGRIDPGEEYYMPESVKR